MTMVLVIQTIEKAFLLVLLTGITFSPSVSVKSECLLRTDSLRPEDYSHLLKPEGSVRANAHYFFFFDLYITSSKFKNFQRYTTDLRISGDVKN